MRIKMFRMGAHRSSSLGRPPADPSAFRGKIVRVGSSV
jgi:hypothetical protein